MGIIYYLSSQSDPVPQVTSVVWDKLLHFVEYGGLATLFARALLGEGLAVPATIVAAVVLTSAYGASDEIHQSTVPQRQADVRDWLVDGVGASVGASITALGMRARASKA
jgi:VanZ family protein